MVENTKGQASATVDAQDLDDAAQALLRMIYAPVLEQGRPVTVSVPDVVPFGYAVQAMALHQKSALVLPDALTHNACLIAKVGESVVIQCGSSQEADEVFDWMARIQGKAR